MKTSWQSQTGSLACRWSEVGQCAVYHPRWFQDASDTQGSYLPSVPDFASHSPFGGAYWSVWGSLLVPTHIADHDFE
jgi:hypothetical protein